MTARIKSGALAIVRTRNSSATLAQCLQSLRAQTVDIPILVVDCMSADRSREIARSYGAMVLPFDPEAYTPGRALNFALEECAAGDVAILLSSHCALTNPYHVERVLQHHEDGGVAATNGCTIDWLGRPIARPLYETQWPHDENVFWGFSNHSSSIAVDLWRKYRFDESLKGCEDKAWARRIHADGLTIVYDPCLAVSTRHRHQQGLLSLFRRAVAEGMALDRIVDIDHSQRVRSIMARHMSLAPRRGVPRVVRLIRPSRIVETAGLARGLSFRGRAAAARPTATNHND